MIAFVLLRASDSLLTRWASHSFRCVVTCYYGEGEVASGIQLHQQDPQGQIWYHVVLGMLLREWGAISYQGPLSL